MYVIFMFYVHSYMMKRVNTKKIRMKTECKKEKENIKDSDLKRNEQLVCGCGKSNIWLSNAIGYCNYCFKNLESKN